MTEVPQLRAPASPPRVTVVVPVYNAMSFLSRTVPALVQAVETHGAAELLFVENESTDGSAEWLRQYGAQVLRAPGATISATRNFGARTGRAPLLAFVDADCLVPPEYLRCIEEAMKNPRIDACGSPYRLPESPHWVERVWHDVHEQQGETVVTYLPAGNFAIRREAFEAVGGFRDDLITGEDADLGLRLTERGYVVYSTPSVWVRHLGNPRSLTAFFRKQRWHALGMFGTVRLRRIDKPVAMTLLHLMLLGLTATLLLYRPTLGLLGLVTAVWLVPLATLTFRRRQGGKVGAHAPAAALLYQAYYLARVVTLLRIVTGRAGRRS
jgi:glycosyltransferase involved in cell wall biosynthesis